jgi:predicted RNase H-like nuclease (RuvC/YqgF family)
MNKKILIFFCTLSFCEANAGFGDFWNNLFSNHTASAPTAPKDQAAILVEDDDGEIIGEVQDDKLYIWKEKIENLEEENRLLEEEIEELNAKIQFFKDKNRVIRKNISKSQELATEVITEFKLYKPYHDYLSLENEIKNMTILISQK